MELNKETMMQLNQRNPKHMSIYKEVLTYAATNGTQEKQVEDYLIPERSTKILFDRLCLVSVAALIYGIYAAYVINFPNVTPMISLQNLGLILIVFLFGIAWQAARFADQKILYQEIDAIIRICPESTIQRAYEAMIKSEKYKK